MSAGNTCAVSVSGYITCWGTGWGYLHVPVDFGKVSQISISSFHGCAITEAGNVKCWGSNRYGGTDVPSEVADAVPGNPVVQISVTREKSCALTSEGKVVCWGNDPDADWNISLPINLKTTSSISVGSSVMCVIANTGELQCFGDESWSGELMPPDLGRVINVSVATFGTKICVTKYSGELECWNWYFLTNENGVRQNVTGYSIDTAIPNTFPKVVGAQANGSVCVITIDGDVRCLGQQPQTISWWNGYSGPVVTPLKPVTKAYFDVDDGEVYTTWNVGFDPGLDQTEYILKASPGNQTFYCSNIWSRTWLGTPIYMNEVRCDATGLINGQDYTFTLTSTNSAGSVTSDPTPVFTPRARWNQIGSPTIIGKASLGGTLTVDTGSWNPIPSFSYQWLRNGSSISGANGQNYTLGLDDIGAEISVTVTSVFPMLETQIYTTDSVHVDFTNGAVLIPNSPCAGAVIDSSVWKGGIKQPSFTGQAVYGQTIIGTPGSWPAKTKLCSFWYSNGQAIRGAFSKTLKLTGTNFGRQVQYVVVGTDSNGVSAMRFTNSITIANAVFAKASPPAIGGTLKVGSVLKSSIKAWESGITYTYQWLRDGQPIESATTATYAVTATDLGSKISLRACGSKAFFNDLCMLSASSANVLPAVFSPAPKVLLLGSSAKVGATLVTSVSNYPNDADVSIQWLRDGIPISGQTGSSYTIVQEDKGHSISMSVMISKAGYVTFIKSAPAKKIS